MLQVIQDHECETHKYSSARCPTEQIGALALDHIGRLAIGHHSAEQVACCKPTEMCKIVGSSHDQAQHANVDKPADQRASQRLCRDTFSAGGRPSSTPINPSNDPEAPTLRLPTNELRTYPA